MADVDNGDSIKFIGSSSEANLDQTCWGIDKNALDLAGTTSVSLNQTVDTVEAKNNQGEVIGLITYNKKIDITVEGISSSMEKLKVSELGETIELEALGGDDVKGTDGDFSSSTIILTEANIELSNEDWKRFSLKFLAYQLVDKKAVDRK